MCWTRLGTRCLARETSTPSQRGPGASDEFRSRKLLDSSGYPEQVKEKNAMTLNTQNKNPKNAESRTRMDEVLMLEIDKNGNVSHVLADSWVKPMTLKNTLLRMLYPN